MAACERCWAIYRMRERFGEATTYADVVAEQEAMRGPCRPAEQCGDMHLVIDGACRCGAVTRTPEDRADSAGGVNEHSQEKT